jgi:hypothetical protein
VTTTLRPTLRAESLWQADRTRQIERDNIAGRRRVQYVCPRGHGFDVPFALDDAEIPPVWECRLHGTTARQPGQEDAAPSKPKHGDRKRLGDSDGRTHWDRVLERRSRPQLEALLEERLADLARCRNDGVPPEPAPRGSQLGRQYS